jgi:hypothetical protein
MWIIFLEMFIIVLVQTEANVLGLGYTPISHPDIRMKHGSIWAFTPTAVTPYTDVFVYKTESCSKTLFSNKAL